MKIPMTSGSFRTALRRRAPVVLCAVGGVVVLLAVVLGAVYLAFQDIALRAISLRDSEFSAQTDALANSMQDMIRNYAMQAFYAPEVTELLENGDITELARVRDLRELGTYVSSSDFVDSITVYNRASNTVYSTDSDVLSDTADRFVDRSAVELFLHLNADMRMRPLRRIAFPGQAEREREYFSFLFFETNAEDEPLGNALMLNVAHDWFVGNLLSFDHRESCVLLDRQRKLIYAPDLPMAQAATFFQAEAAEEENTGYLLRNYHGEQMVCHFSKIQSNGWYCLQILPMEEALPGLLQLRNTLAAWLTLAVALLVAAASATLIFLYAPFQKIRLALQRVSAGPPELQIRSLVQDSVQYQQSRVLVALLEGKPLPPEQLPAAPMTLLLLECADPVATRAFLLEECPTALLRHERGWEAVLIPGFSELDVMTLCGALTTHAGCRCYCGIPRATAALLPLSYATLQELQELRFWYPGQQILSEKHFLPRTVHSSLSEKELAALLSALRGGELEEGRALWKHILESVRGDTYRDQRFAFRRVAQLLQETLTEQGQETEQILPDEFLTELADINALTARFDLFFRRISQDSIDHRRRRLGDIAAQVAHRIDVGYENTDLSPPRIADEMGMSSAYLGRLFRESLGQSIGEYMNQVRVENGRRLLLATDMTVEAVASAVGFGNAKYFFVVFKNATGQTPLQFRKQYGAASTREEK